MRSLLLLIGFFVTLSVSARPEPEVKLSPEEKRILELTNAEREKAKLPALKPNPLLMDAARAHTANMATTGRLDHTLDNETPADRLKKRGYAYARYGENIASGEDSKPEDLFRVWMESPPHKANLLNGDYSEIGLGWVKPATGSSYATQVFGKPSGK